MSKELNINDTSRTNQELAMLQILNYLTKTKGLPALSHRRDITLNVTATAKDLEGHDIQEAVSLRPITTKRGLDVYMDQMANHSTDSYQSQWQTAVSNRRFELHINTNTSIPSQLTEIGEDGNVDYDLSDVQLQAIQPQAQVILLAYKRSQERMKKRIQHMQVYGTLPRRASEKLGE